MITENIYDAEGKLSKKGTEGLPRFKLHWITVTNWLQNKLNKWFLSHQINSMN